MNSGCDKNCPMCRAPTASCEQQHTRALRWAGKGKAWAMAFVAVDFDLGRGVSASKVMARLWYEKAAEQEHFGAQFMLGCKCFSCGNTGTMKCCSRCKCAYYCSRDCQAAAWKSGHKATCKQIRRMQKTVK